MDTEERVSALERKVAEYDRIIAWLMVYARMTRAGRVFLKGLGLS